MGSNLFKTCWNEFKCVQTGSKLVQMCQMCSSLSKTCSNVFKIVQNCSKIIRVSSARGPTWQAELDLVVVVMALGMSWVLTVLHISCFLAVIHFFVHRLGSGGFWSLLLVDAVFHVFCVFWVWINKKFLLPPLWPTCITLRGVFCFVWTWILTSTSTWGGDYFWN